MDHELLEDVVLIVPESLSCDTLLLGGDDVPGDTGKTAPFIVIDTLIRSSGMPSKRILMSPTESTPSLALPTSPTTRGWSLS